MLRSLKVIGLSACALLWACDETASSNGADLELDAAANGGDDGFDDSEDPIDTDNGGGNPQPPMDAGKQIDASDAGNSPDAGKAVDAGKRVDAGNDKPYGDDCEEVFVFDPAGLTDVNNVVLTGDYSLWNSWVPTVSAGAIPMMLGTDGRYYVGLYLNEEVFQYKFVVNGDSASPKWLADPANCLDANDNFGGRNSIRYACQAAPMCPEIPDAGSPDAGERDAGERDAGERDAGERDAGDSKDAGHSDAGGADGSVGSDAGPQDASVAMDAEVADAGDAGPLPDANVDAGAGDVDVELGDDCIEVFEVDPENYPEYAPIVSVELRGAAPFSYDEAVVVLHEDSDGMFRANVAIDKLSFKYNVVINGKEYLRDRDYCPSADDGFGGRGASLRSTCQTPACCEEIDITWDPAQSSCTDVQEAAFVGQLASWLKPGVPMTLSDDGKFHITFRDAPGSYQYKVLVNGAYISSPDDNCTDDAETALVVNACLQ